MHLKNLALLLSTLIVSACTSNQYLIAPESAGNFNYTGNRVSVENREVTEQLSILEGSEIYNIVDSSETDTKLYLINYGRHPSCGMPFMASTMSLGLWPVSITETHYFSYEIRRGTNSNKYIHEIPIKLRVSIWEWLAKPFSNSEKEILIKALPFSKRRLSTEQDPI